MQTEYNRRKFIRKTAISGFGIAMMPSMLLAQEKKTKVRIGMIAVERSGHVYLKELPQRKDVEIVALQQRKPVFGINNDY